MDNVSIFRFYVQPENRFTNGFISILKLLSKAKVDLVTSFFTEYTNIKISKNAKFKVLRDIKGTADAEISEKDKLILIETKIRSGILDKNQINRHLKMLQQKYKQKNKKLILLTPDDKKSNYIKNFKKLSKKIDHISWLDVIKFLNAQLKKNEIICSLIKDYLSEIQEKISDEDIAAVIVKIKFGGGKNFEKGSMVNPYTYLKEMKNNEWEDDWHTPSKYEELDGTGRKLILYDDYVHGITVEVEIDRVRRDPQRKGNSKFPISNSFVMDTLNCLECPIPLKKILKIPKTQKNILQTRKDGKEHGFINFKKCQTSHWNLTRHQYEYLIKGVK